MRSGASLTRDLLHSLDDPVALSRNPLVSACFTGTCDSIAHKRVQAIVAEAVEALRPQPRQYEIVWRYDVSGQSIRHVCASLGIEKSQFYRERAKAFERLAARIAESSASHVPALVETSVAFEYRTAEALQQSGNFDMAFEILDRVARSVSDPLEKAECLLRTAEVHLDVGDALAAEQRLALAENHIQDARPSSACRCYADLVRAQILWATGRTAEARRWIGHVVQSLETGPGFSDPFARILLGKTIALNANLTFHVSTLSECRGVVDYGCEVSASSGEPARDLYADFLTVRTSINAASSETLETAGADDAALLEFARNHRLLRKIAVGIKDLAVINQYRGQDSQAKMYADQALALSLTVSGAKERAVAVFEWARMYADKCDDADLAASRVLIQEIRARLPRGGYWWGYSYATDSYVLLAQRRADEALGAADEALSTFRFVKSDRGIGIARSLQSQSLRMLGNAGEAALRAEQAVVHLDRAPNPFWLQYARRCLA